MKKGLVIIGLSAAFGLGFFLQALSAEKPEIPRKERSIKTNNEKKNDMKLGAFSISLSVKHLEVSKQFYENLGFKVFAGGMEQKYLIMKNGNALIGLFHGMFQGNILTFNPGWDENAQNMEQFDDIREIQKKLKSKNVPLNAEADETTTGPASVMLTDPDGNVILLDQHR